ncbi:hypothetical protein D3C80_1968240 [compost metagenome]
MVNQLNFLSSQAKLLVQFLSWGKQLLRLANFRSQTVLCVKLHIQLVVVSFVIFLEVILWFPVEDWYLWMPLEISLLRLKQESP